MTRTATRHAPVRLPDDFAAALGHSVASFGYLEEALKRCLFSLSRHALGDDPDDRALKRWLARIEDLVDDSMGTLIDQFAAQASRAGTPGRHELVRQLNEVRRWRNLLCHASWRPTEVEGHWHPAFLNTRKQRFPDDLDIEAVRAVHTMTLETARQVLAVMERTGVDGRWPGGEDRPDRDED